MSDRIQEAAPDVPAGYELGPGGLVVPVGTAPLEHEQWRHEDGMAILRALRIAKAHGLRLIVGCDDNRCAENPVITERMTPNHGMAWVCGHKERVLTKGPSKKSPWRRR